MLASNCKFQVLSVYIKTFIFEIYRIQICTLDTVNVSIDCCEAILQYMYRVGQKSKPLLIYQ